MRLTYVLTLCWSSREVISLASIRSVKYQEPPSLSFIVISARPRTHTSFSSEIMHLSLCNDNLGMLRAECSANKSFGPDMGLNST